MATTTRSPLRWQALPPGQARRTKHSVNAAASARLRHLQAVATWASAHVGPLGAFLGSRLASASESLGSPPPPSPHFTCQRCESILQVGVNCSVRVRSRKRKKRNSACKESSRAINSILYFCSYCAVENMKSGTPNAYVKAKLREVAACDRLLELNKGLGEKLTKTPTQSFNNKLVSFAKGITVPSTGSSGKRQKRKGWPSLKQLTASSTGLSDGRSDLTKSAAIIQISQMKNLESPKIVPMISRADIKCITSLSMKEKCSSGVIKTANSLLEHCSYSSGDKSSNTTSNLTASFRDSVVPEHSLTFTTDMMCNSLFPPQYQAGEAAPISQCDAESVWPKDKNGERKTPNAACSSLLLRQNYTSAVPFELEKEDQQHCCQLDAEALIVDQPTSPVLDHYGLTSVVISQLDVKVVAPTPCVQERNGRFLKPLESAWPSEEGVLMPADMVLQPRKPAKENLSKHESGKQRSGLLNSTKRQLEEHDKWHKVAKSKKQGTWSGMHCAKDFAAGKGRHDLALGREANPKKRPVYRRMGRHWFTTCSLRTKCRSRTFKWRII